MQSKAKTVAEYLASLPEDRRQALEAIRKVFLASLDRDYEECMQYGMIGYVVPHRVFPDGYHCDPKQPLPFAGLASQKGHMSLYLMAFYGPQGEPTELAEWFRDAWTATGRKLDMGKACVRFKKLEDVPLDVLGEAIRRLPCKAYVAQYTAARDQAATRKPANRAAKSAGKARTAKAPANKPTKASAAKKNGKAAAKAPARQAR